MNGDPEEALLALESRLNLPVTIIDNAFFFNERNVFPAERRSHRRFPVCLDGFSEQCVEHCRYEMNSRSLREAAPFVTACYKGVSQIVAPLRYNGVHYGMLYLGLWESGEEVPEELLPLAGLCADGVMMQLVKERKLESVPDERGARIASFLREHAAEKVGLEELAAELSLSVSRAGAVVRECFGKNFTDLLLAGRVERVKDYLSGSELKLRAIAAKCGFSDEFHLSRVFRKLTGMTPSEWRRSRTK